MKTKNRNSFTVTEDETLARIREGFARVGMTLQDALREGISDLKNSRNTKAKKISPEVGA